MDKIETDQRGQHEDHKEDEPSPTDDSAALPMAGLDITQAYHSLKLHTKELCSLPHVSGVRLFWQQV